MEIVSSSMEDSKELSKLIAKEFPYTKASKENLESRLEKKEILVFKAVERKEMLGFIDLEFLDEWKGIVRINGIAVKEEHRRKGIGKELMEFALEFCRKLNASKIVLLVKPSNSNAKKMYESIGFKSKGFWSKLVDNEKVEEMELLLKEAVT